MIILSNRQKEREGAPPWLKGKVKLLKRTIYTPLVALTRTTCRCSAPLLSRSWFDNVSFILFPFSITVISPSLPLLIFNIFISLYLSIYIYMHIVIYIINVFIPLSLSVCVCLPLPAAYKTSLYLSTSFSVCLSVSLKKYSPQLYHLFRFLLDIVISWIFCMLNDAWRFWYIQYVVRRS